MSERQVQRPDPLMDGVCERRGALLEECGGTLEGVFRRVQEEQARHPERLVDRRKMRDRAAAGVPRTD